MYEKLIVQVICDKEIGTAFYVAPDLLLTAWHTVESFKNDGNWIKVRESYFPLNIDGSIYIYSLIDDITEEAKKEEALMNLAYNNPISKFIAI